jgi:hypothetical protein
VTHVRVRAEIKKAWRVPEDSAWLEFPAGLRLPSKLVFELVFLTNGPEAYDLELEIAFQDGRYVCSGLRMRQHDDRGPVTGDAIRSVPIKMLVRQGVYAYLLEEQEPAEEGVRLIAWRDKVKPPEDLAKQGATEETLRWVAQTYELAVALNDPPTKTVQDMLGVSRATAGRWVAEARKRGLLDGED